MLPARMPHFQLHERRRVTRAEERASVPACLRRLIHRAALHLAEFGSTLSVSFLQQSLDGSTYSLVDESDELLDSHSSSSAVCRTPVFASLAILVAVLLHVADPLKFRARLQSFPTSGPTSTFLSGIGECLVGLSCALEHANTNS